MTEKPATRKIEHEIQDFVALLITGDSPYVTKEISEDEIAKFCKGCDSYRENQPCALAGTNDQARYAARQWCGWASQKSVSGQMTTEGFKSGSVDLNLTN